MVRAAIIVLLPALLAVLVLALARDVGNRRRRARLERLAVAFLHGSPFVPPRPAPGGRAFRCAGLELTLPARWKVEQVGEERLVCGEGPAAGAHVTLARALDRDQEGWEEAGQLSSGMTLAKRLDLAAGGARVVYAWRLCHAGERVWVARLEVDVVRAGDLLVLDDVAAIAHALREARRISP